MGSDRARRARGIASRHRGHRPGARRRGSAAAADDRADAASGPGRRTRRVPANWNPVRATKSRTYRGAMLNVFGMISDRYVALLPWRMPVRAAARKRSVRSARSRARPDEQQLRRACAGGTRAPLRPAPVHRGRSRGRTVELPAAGTRALAASAMTCAARRSHAGASRASRAAGWRDGSSSRRASAGPPSRRSAGRRGD